MFALEYNPGRSLTTCDAALGALFDEIRDVIGPSGLNVMVVGNSGTGKEGAAKAIHWWSDRREGIFLAINCATIPEGLAESELFGHEKGAYTGANYQRKGYFETADGGTVFLDEVAELPLALQAKLLRVLEEGEIFRVGSSRAIHIDVRVVAATNRDVKALVAAGKFREDLYYRLAADTIRIPSLCERPGDVVFLAEMFAREAGERKDIPGVTISPEVAELLRRHHWPGNVRELKWLIRSAVARFAVRRGDRTAIMIEDLPRGFSAEPAPATQQPHVSQPQSYRPLYDQILEQLSLAQNHTLTIPELARITGRPKDTVRRAVDRMAIIGNLRVSRKVGPGGAVVEIL